MYSAFLLFFVQLNIDKLNLYSNLEGNRKGDKLKNVKMLINEQGKRKATISFGINGHKPQTRTCQKTGKKFK